MLKLEDVPNAVSEILEKVNNIEIQLRSAGSTTSQVDEGPLDISEAAKLLNLSKNTIYKLVQKRELPYSKKAKRLYFVRQELLEWVMSGKEKTQAELKQEAETRFTNANKRRH